MRPYGGLAWLHDLLRADGGVELPYELVTTVSDSWTTDRRIHG